ncbi:isochorismate synthase [Merismopedia glauca]|uniref:isochorismate synthase n=1 Tax=Merismopedia glauca CCAP 1448/3 TaxID=1296344 RepID=A0A2T1BZV5_9CYAN|nr:isochorismate synthase [Merismopedia glauca]PSB01457.1 isochorismate synthase [Merismopedia glauca CCAP 1448/3]
MTVTPLRPHRFQDYDELHQFLLLCQQNLHHKEQSKIISISLEVPAIDPLVILEKMAQPERLSFYWEQPEKSEAIAAIDAVTYLTVAGDSRFQAAEEFMAECLEKTTIVGDKNHRWLEPLFFCIFTFLDRVTQPHPPFLPATVFLPKLQVFRRGNTGGLVANLKVDKKTNIDALTKQTWQQFQLVKKQGNSVGNRLTKSSYKPSIQIVDRESDRFKSGVNSALELIKNNQISKIVLAHCIEVIVSEKISVVECLNKLRDRHPDCYIFAANNGKGQVFLGASPERLISIKNGQLIADALAGSAPRGKTPTQDAEFANLLLSSEKERREHHAVLEFITDRLQKLGLTPQAAEVPQILPLANIQHIWTPIQAQVTPKVHPLQIISLLHPTPAVAGTPTKIACQHIRRFEPFERGLYAAPLGWINHQGDAEFIVGIRSALVEGDRAKLYAGAGIVAGSDPEQEFAEIQLKLQPLLKALV